VLRIQGRPGEITSRERRFLETSVESVLAYGYGFGRQWPSADPGRCRSLGSIGHADRRRNSTQRATPELRFPDLLARLLPLHRRGIHHCISGRTSTSSPAAGGTTEFAPQHFRKNRKGSTATTTAAARRPGSSKPQFGPQRSQTWIGRRTSRPKIGVAMGAEPENPPAKRQMPAPRVIQKKFL